MNKNEKAAAVFEKTSTQDLLHKVGEIFSRNNPIKVSNELIFAKNAEDCYQTTRIYFWGKVWVSVMAGLIITLIMLSFDIEGSFMNLVKVIAVMAIAYTVTLLIRKVNCRPNIKTMSDDWKPFRKTIVKNRRRCKMIKVGQFDVVFKEWLEEIMKSCAFDIVRLEKDGIEYRKKHHDRKQALTDLWMEIYGKGTGQQPPWAKVFSEAINCLTDVKKEISRITVTFKAVK